MERLLLVLLVGSCFSHCSFARNLTEIRYHFTTCGASGRNGPIPVRRICVDHYGEINSPIQSLLFGFGATDTFVGAQGFRLPQAGLYNITVAGAAGGRGICNPVFGIGAVQRLQVELTLEYELLILVGQHGLSPCEVISNPELYRLVCENPPRTINESEDCNTLWREWVIETYNSSALAGFSGGGGGGGASMVRLRDAESGQFEAHPLVVAAGGGGSPAVVVYDANPILDLNSSRSVEEQYLLYLDGRRYSQNVPIPNGIRGYRDLRFTTSSPGAGGGWARDIGRIDAIIDGMPLSETQNFAQGGANCVLNILEGVYGGFGGGGGGCGGGGGGGGYMGGSVFFRGNANEELGGGGHSVYFSNSPVAVIDRGSGYNLASLDGYVDIVLSDCGCVHECVVDEVADQFECLCPENAQLATDQSDCFKVIEINVTEAGMGVLNLDEFRFTTLSLSSQHHIFSLEVNLTTVPNQQRKRGVRQAGDTVGEEEELCAVALVGSNSIVLISNVVRGAGMTQLLAPVTHDNDTFIISNYTLFLNSSELVRGAILVSTGLCSVVDASIRTDVSIREASEGSPDYSMLQMIDQQVVHNFASRVLQLQVSPSASPTAMTPPSNPAVSRDGITALVVVVVLLGVIIVGALVALPVGYWVCRSRRKMVKFVTTNAASENPEVVSNDCTSLGLITNTNYGVLVPSPKDSSDHGYEMLNYEGEGQSEEMEVTSLERCIAPRFGISAPVHNFSDYNRQRSNTIINDWEYPRSNLIYLRELGEGQFGKVLLMKAKGIAGFTDNIPVAVKTLSSTDPAVVNKFMEEAELMKKFSHPNIVSLLGISSAETSEDSAPLMILEYMQYGDLQGFLEAQRPKKNRSSPITEQHFYSFATDVVTALEFLAASKYVHRDIAARNCLVGSALRIKIADFGLARGVDNKDYYRVAGRTVLPVRWMAPECLLYGVFTTASDVWSYGVLLWEIVTYGQLPLKDLDVQEIVERAQNESLEHPRPENCPDGLYSVMSECHSCDADKRPSFTDILVSFSKNRSDTEVSIAV